MRKKFYIDLYRDMCKKLEKHYGVEEFTQIQKDVGRLHVQGW